MCGAIALNLLLLLFAKMIHFEMRYFGGGSFTVIGFCSKMLDFLKEYGRYADGATDAPFYTVVRFLEIIGVIGIVAAAVKTFLPMFTGDGKPILFKLLKIAVIFSVALTFLFLLICTAALSSQDGIKSGLTFLGWVYVLKSVIMIAALFKLSPQVKKAA